MEITIDTADTKYLVCYDETTDETTFEILEADDITPLNGWEEQVQSKAVFMSFWDYVERFGLNEYEEDYAPSGNWDSHSTRTIRQGVDEFIGSCGSEQHFREFATEIMKAIGWV